jgi:hypothetical protein
MMKYTEGKGNGGDFMQIPKKEFDTMIKELHEGRKTTKLILEKNAELMGANRELMLMGLVKQALLMLEKRMNHDTQEVEKLRGDLEKYQAMPGHPDV